MHNKAEIIKELCDLLYASAPLTWTALHDMDAAAAWERRAVALLKQVPIHLQDGHPEPLIV